MQFSKPDSALQHFQRLERESSANINSYIGLLLEMQKQPLASVGRCLFHLAFVRARCYCETTSEQWTQKHFQACKRREDALELANQTSPTHSLGNKGSRDQSPKGRVHTHGNKGLVWRKCGGTVTCSVLNHFQGIEWLLLDFMMLTGVSWFNPRKLALKQKQGREGKTGFWTSLWIPSPYTSPVVTRVSSQT